MSTAQTLLLFCSGFVVSRALIRAGAHRVAFERLLAHTGAVASRLVAAIIASAALLSMFVPNALTVLALLPAIQELQRAKVGGHEPKLATLLTMGLVYGANIGGMASLIGSPANLYLLLNLHILQIEARQQLHFLSWLAFGLPMALALGIVAWGTLRVVEAREMTRPAPSDLSSAQPQPTRRVATRLALVWAGFWIVLLAASASSAPTSSFALAGLGRFDVTDGIAAGFSVLLGLVLFSMRVSDSPLLDWRDLVRDLPLRGIALALLVAAILYAVAKSGLVAYLERLAPALIPAGVGPLTGLIVICLVATFATEMLSNTLIATILFPLVAGLAPGLGLSPLVAMLAVSLASTCAFMTPVATPVNALAFGSIRGLSLRMFLTSGLLINLLSALWIATCLRWLVPRVLGQQG